MRNLRLVGLAVGWALAQWTAANIYGADKEVNYCKTPPNPPAGLSVSLALKNGQTAFRQGEIINLVTSNTSENEREYFWNSKSYDRAGRNSMEAFCLEPGAGRDPLHDYFDSRLAISGGGLFGVGELGQEPQTTNLDLNEWLSLPPGEYRLSVVSYRISTTSEDQTSAPNRKPIPLRSNEVEFTVVEAEAEWQSAQIRSAVEELNRENFKAKTTDAENREVYFDSDERIHAKRVLRFIGTRESEHEIAVRFAEAPEGEANWEYIAGLWAATDRAAVIEDMKAVLRSHDKVNKYFVQNLVELEMYADPKWRSVFHENRPINGWQVYLDELNRRTDAYMAEIGMTREQSQ